MDDADHDAVADRHAEDLERCTLPAEVVRAEQGDPDVEHPVVAGVGAAEDQAKRHEHDRGGGDQLEVAQREALVAEHAERRERVRGDGDGGDAEVVPARADVEEERDKGRGCARHEQPEGCPGQRRGRVGRLIVVVEARR